MVMYREVCPEGVQNKCPGGVWCRDFMSWGDTLILVISRGVQLYYGIAHYYFILLGGGATFCRAGISKCSLTTSNKCFTGSGTEWYILCKVHEWIGFFLTP